MTIVPFTSDLHELVAADAVVEQLATGCEWSEGPVWVPATQSVWWSDIPNDRIMCWTEGDGATELATGVEFTNGHTLHPDGTVISCSHGNRRIERREIDGTVTGLVDRFDDKRLNSPNDVVVKSDGTIWFTDPPYGIASDHEGHAAEPEQVANHVFRFDPSTGATTIATATVEEPNGLAFSLDESTLYVSDTSAALRSDGSGNHHIVAFDVVDGPAGPASSLTNERRFAEIEPGLPDGFRIAETGHVFTSSASGIQVLTEHGAVIGRIDIPEKTSNCVFGGPTGTTLFVTASTSLYRVELLVRGAVQR